MFPPALGSAFISNLFGGGTSAAQKNARNFSIQAMRVDSTEPAGYNWEVGRVKDRLIRMGKANAEAEDRYLKSLTQEKAIEVLEGILGHMPYAPPPPDPEDRPETGRKLSIGKLLKRKR